MSTVAELLVKISADSSGLRRELAASQRQMKRAFGSEGMAISSGVIGGLGLVTAALGGVGIAAVKMAADMEQNKIAFTTMLGSAQAAESMLSQLATFAEKTPFEFTGLVNSTKRLLAYGYTAQEIIPTLTSIGDAVAAMGGSSEVLDRVTLAFGQMKAKGFVSGEEMRQLAEAGIPAWQFLANAIGKTIPEAMKLAEDKALNAEAAMAGMLAQMTTKYGGMMEKQSGTITGILSNIKDKSGTLMRTMGDEIVQALDLKKRLQGALTFLDDFSARVKNSGVKEAIMEMIPPDAMAAIYALAGAITAVLIPALAGLAMTATVAGVLMWKLVAIGAVVGIVAGTMYQLADANSEASQRLKASASYMSDIQVAADGAAIAVDRLARATASLGAGVGSPEEFFAGTGTKSIYAEKPAPGPMITGGKAGGGGKSAFEKLADEAKRVSEAIEREWAQTTKTQLEQLDRWQAEQIADLDKTQAANENYERDKERVAATYSVRRQKILQSEAIDALNVYKSIRDGYQNMQRDMLGLKGPAKDVSDINKTYDDKAKAASDYFEKISQDYMTGTEVQKQVILKSLNDQNIAYQLSADGKLNLDKATADASVAYQKQKLDELNIYYKSAKDVQSQIDEAYRQNSMTALQAALSEENAARMNDYEAQQSLMRTYQSVYLASHKSNMAYMSEALESFQSGMQDIFMSIGKNINSVGDLFRSFGEMVLGIIIKIQAQAAAASITSALMGMFGLGAKSTPLIPGGASSSGSVASIIAGRLAGGGQIFGAGTGTSDSILARLSNGEFVINAASVKKYGAGFFDRLNAGRMPAFAAGGAVGGGSFGGGTSTESAPGVKVNINNYGNADVQAGKPQYDEQSKSYILNVMIDGLRNNSALRGAARGVR